AQYRHSILMAMCWAEPARCSRPGPHPGGSEYVRLAAAPAAELRCSGATRGRSDSCDTGMSLVVMPCCHLPFCRQYPTATGVAGNGGVRSSPDNVSSAPRSWLWPLPGASPQGDSATASIRAVGDQDGVVGSTQVK